MCKEREKDGWRVAAITNQHVKLLVLQDWVTTAPRMHCLDIVWSKADSVRLLCRGTTTTVAQLSSRMRGMALETEDCDPEITADSGRDPVVLVLDSITQALPWESMPALRAQK